jgi:phage baseplate assembly protein W
MPQQTKAEVFSDFDLAFIAHPVKKSLNRKVNREAVKQSVKSLILTDFYERPFKSNIGCGIRGMLFENTNQPALIQTMENTVREVIRNFEPRADIIELLIEDRPDLNALTISIAFMVVNDPDPIILDVLLERVR